MPNVPPYTKFVRQISEPGLTTDQNEMSAQVEKLTEFVNSLVPAIAPAELYALTPESGAVGTEVLITGQNLQGVTFLYVGDVSVPFSVLSSTTIRFVVTSAMKSGGVVRVISTSGPGASDLFFIVPNTVPTVGTVTVNPTPSVAGAPVLLSVDTTDVDGIQEVQFIGLLGPQSVVFGSTSSPISGNTYQISWTPSTAGNYSVRAKVVDNRRGTALSPYSSLVVTAQSLPAGVAPTLTVDGVNRKIAAVPAFAGDVIEQNINNGGWEEYTGIISIGFQYREAGYYRFRTRANSVRSMSPIASSPEIAAVPSEPPLGNQGPQNPTILVNTTTMVAKTSYVVKGTVTSANPIISAVFYEGTKILQTDTIAPYEVSYTPEETGPVILKVVYRDSNNRTAEATVAVNVIEATVGNNPPTVSLVAPTTQTITQGASLPWSILATDTDGTITSREFLVAGSVAGTGTSGNYTFNTPGTFQVAARATDNNNVSVTSSSVTITVSSAVVYNTTMSISNQIADGMSFVPPTTETLEFNLINLTSGATYSLAITSLGAVSYVDFASEYAGQAYRFTNNAGTKFTGIFPSVESSTITY